MTHLAEAPLRGKQYRLPSFLIVGCMKSGTSALASALNTIPGVYLPEEEPHYFSDPNRRQAGISAYAKLFEMAPEGSAIGEKSPGYAYETGTAERIAETLPDARLIWLFREPCARAYSHYWSFVAKRKETLSFEAALEAESDRVEKNGASWGYFACGCYDVQVEAYLRCFKRSQMLFLDHDCFEQEPARVLGEVCRFLGVTPDLDEPPHVKRVNATRVPRSIWVDRVLRGVPKNLPGNRLIAMLRSANRRAGYPPMRPETRVRLRERFGPHITHLEAITGLDLTHWKANCG